MTLISETAFHRQEALLVVTGRETRMMNSICLKQCRLPNRPVTDKIHVGRRNVLT